MMTIHKTPNPNRWSLNPPHPVLFNANRLTSNYRPPIADTIPLLDMQDVLQNSTYQDLVIIGDFNLPGIDWFDVRATCDSANNSLLIDIIQDNFLTQLVNETTRE